MSYEQWVEDFEFYVMVCVSDCVDTLMAIFLPKINKLFLRPITQNMKGRSVLENFF